MQHFPAHTQASKHTRRQPTQRGGNQARPTWRLGGGGVHESGSTIHNTQVAHRQPNEGVVARKGVISLHAAHIQTATVKHTTAKTPHKIPASVHTNNFERTYLCCNAHGACVCVALAHHDAAHGDQGGGGKTKLLGTQQRSNSDVTTCAHLTISLQTQQNKRVGVG